MGTYLCVNPDQNADCRGEVFKKGGLCRSCAARRRKRRYVCRKCPHSATSAHGMAAHYRMHPGHRSERSKKRKTARMRARWTRLADDASARHAAVESVAAKRPQRGGTVRYCPHCGCPVGLVQEAMDLAERVGFRPRR